jgi:5-methyltetrahydrofolate--homocysteine methyltransferase
VDFALAQTAEGAAILDVCLISASSYELRDAAHFYSRAALKNHPPFMIDSRSPETMERALQICGAGNFLNSSSLEDKVHLGRVCRLAKLYRSGIVIACRDDAGLAITRQRKLEIAQRTLDRMDPVPESVIVDVLAFPVATLPEGLTESLAAIELIRKACPEARTLLALSNFSFGMPAQQRIPVEMGILNDASSAGLDFVILNTRRHR